MVVNQSTNNGTDPLEVRVALLELEVGYLKSSLNEISSKLDDLLQLRSKGVGAFWLASALLGSGIVGTILTFIRWLEHSA